MSEHFDEKEDSAASEPAFHIRPVRPEDGEAIFDLFERTVQYSIDNTRDEASSLEKIQRMVSNASKPVQDVHFLVAERSTPLSASKRGTKKSQAGGVQTPGQVFWDVLC